jgi:integrase
MVFRTNPQQKGQKMKTPEFPILITRGSATVKIYHTPNGDYDAYTISHWHNGKRTREKFGTLPEAKEAAATAANRMSTGACDVLTLTSADRASYLRSKELLPSGVPLEMAVAQFSEAQKILGTTSVVEAARYFAKVNPSKLPSKTVSATVVELITDRRANGAGEYHLRILKGMLDKFAEAHQVEITSVDGPIIRAFLTNLPVVARTKNNYRQAIMQLFNFAKFMKYLPKDHQALDGVDEFREVPGEVEIYTPSELSLLLNHARHELKPFLCIAAFAGLRHAEICRLDWKEVNLTTGYIKVTAQNAKTASQRLIPITPNLAKWLATFSKPSGPVCDRDDMTKPLLKLAKKKALRKSGFKWKHNALRHSFCSYRLADIKNTAQVALEAGNSPQMIFKHYREVVTEQDAKTWFAIEPMEAAKVVLMAA